MDKSGLQEFQEKLNQAIEKNIEFLSNDAKRFEQFLDSKKKKTETKQKPSTDSEPFTV